MSQYFELHPVTPQARLIRRGVEIIKAGGVIAYPTDSCYALGCHIGDKDALERAEIDARKAALARLEAEATSLKGSLDDRGARILSLEKQIRESEDHAADLAKQIAAAEALLKDTRAAADKKGRVSADGDLRRFQRRVRAVGNALQAWLAPGRDRPFFSCR